MTIEERDFARTSEDLGKTIWRLRETVRVAKLAATHRLGQMRSLLMHERHKVWKREFGLDRLGTAAEMDEKHSRISTSPVTNPLFYRSMVILDQPHTPEEFSLQRKVDVEGLRMEIILSQPPSSECDTSPRRAAVNTGSKEPETPPQSPAVSTGSGPEGEVFSFEANREVFLRSKYTSLEEEYILLQVQPDGMDDSNNATTSQDTTREESARLLIGQQQRMAAWSTDQSEQFDRGRLLRCKIPFF